MSATTCIVRPELRRASNRPLMGRARPPQADKGYTAIMARGFESKSVESQQEEAQRARPKKPALTEEERVRQARRTGLELALAETQAEMSASCRPAHREMLKLKLEAIQARIRDL